MSIYLTKNHPTTILNNKENKTQNKLRNGSKMQPLLFYHYIQTLLI